jgi:hypothetical protein
MGKLKLGPIEDERPVKLTIELSAPVHRDLLAYAEALGRETGQPIADPARLVGPMVARFISGDRAFASLRNVRRRSAERAPQSRKASAAGSG